MKRIALIAAMLALSACASGDYRRYTLLHADGSYTRTDVRPAGEADATCGRGLWRNVDWWNKQVDHAADITATKAQIICMDTIR